LKAKETGKFTIFGNDYPTKDGTCVREYVHVNDICRALIKAIDEPSNSIENLAYGDPRTTKEIVKLFAEVNKLNLNVEYDPRREGDLAESYLKNPSRYMKRNYTYEEMLKV
jgi:UDP-glucose 4-epimerase